MSHWIFVNTGLLLELLNGGAVTPELLWLVMIGVYLSREARRRGLHAFDWFRLPPSMDLMLAIFISDFGIWLKSIVVWLWRRRGAGDFSNLDVALLFISGVLIVLGPLCKIRAMTGPDHGRVPWLIALTWTVVVGIALLVFR